MSAKKPMPAWLHQHLVETGHLDGDGFSRRARAGHCRRCGSPVVRGLDADAMALPVTVDPQPLTSDGEAIVLMLGRRTYQLARTAHGLRVDGRGQFEISGTPADSPAAFVVAEHRCPSDGGAA